MIHPNVYDIRKQKKLEMFKTLEICLSILGPASYASSSTSFIYPYVYFLNSIWKINF